MASSPAAQPPHAPPSPPQKPFTIAIIGGGIGGVALAIGLLNRGVRVQIYEAAPAFTEIGAGVSFGPNSLRAMRLIDPSIGAAFDRLATKNADPAEAETWMNVRRGEGDVEEGGEGNGGGNDLLLRIRTTDRGKTGLSSVHRTHFLNAMARLIPSDAAHLGRRLVNLRQVLVPLDVNTDSNSNSNRNRNETDNNRTPNATTKKLVRLEFEDGSVADADAVVGCDGLRSRVRQLLLGLGSVTQDLTFSGKYAYRGLIPMDKAVGVLGDYFARNCQMYVGRGAYVFHYPIDHGRLVNVIAVRTQEDGKWQYDRWVQARSTRELQEAFKGWRRSVRDLLAQLDSPTVWALFDHSPAPAFYSDRIAILGDAAHASTPHQGSGAGQALEDAFILSNMLGDPSIRSADDIPAAFKAFDAVRRPRSQKAVTTSREAGKVFSLQGQGVGECEEKLIDDLSRRQRWIWEVDHQVQLEKAKVKLRAALSEMATGGGGGGGGGGLVEDVDGSKGDFC